MSIIRNKNVVVIGGSRGIGREIVRRTAVEGARVLSVARGKDDLDTLTKEASNIVTLALDATMEDAPSRVFEALRPGVLVLCGGAIPPIEPLHRLTWDQFTANWVSDVRMSFLFCREALRAPLDSGSVVILVSSGAGLGGSPISGGYAGAKRMQMFMANYCQKESERLSLGIRFLALAPMRIMPETQLGRTAVEGYARYLGIPPQDFIASLSNRQSAADVADAVMSIAAQGAQAKDTLLMISAAGLAPQAQS